jgi:ubiquinone/menaquinone biosynthesis C-methylase UbiE
LYSAAAAVSSILWAVACTANSLKLGEQVAEFWNSQPCGERYLGADFDFESQARARYSLEPHILHFANFSSAPNLRVLEIGVGIGADYERWLKAGALATGVDLSNASLELARRRCERAGLTPDLHQADAEQLPFASNSFDVVYSYGVMHHSPNPAKCIQEAYRVLKPGGEARIMLYHHPSVTGLMLWLRYGIWRGQSIRQCIYEYLESPATKSYTRDEVYALMCSYEDVRIEQAFSPGDLLLHQPSGKFCRAAYRVVWKFFPRALVRKVGRRRGLFLLISATKGMNSVES